MSARSAFSATIEKGSAFSATIEKGKRFFLEKEAKTLYSEVISMAVAHPA